MAKKKVAAPNCYECMYRGEVPGSAHSCCNHPSNKKLHDDPFLNLMAIFASVGRVAPVAGVGDEKMIVKGSLYGIQKGWFNYPFNFDPVWLEECNGFKGKKK